MMISCNRYSRWPASISMLAALLVAAAIAPARASFHDWDINEIYSNADGSIQFIELMTTSNGQQFVKDHTLVVTDTNNMEHVFTFPSNTPAGTANKTLLLATEGFAAISGGVEPDFIIPPNFLFPDTGTLNFGEGWEVINYSGLPTDGVASLVRSGNTLVLSATNSPRNFAGDIGTVTPALRILAPTLAELEFVFSFDTSTGKTYTVEFTDSLSPTNWQTLSSFPGSGSQTAVTNTTAEPSERFYRLRVE